MDCSKLQQITRKGPAGDTVYTKCINKSSKRFSLAVTESDCSSCPLKQHGPCKGGCMKPRRQCMDFEEPILVGSNLQYADESVPVPDGFIKEGTLLVSQWPVCHGLSTTNTLNDDGTIAVVHFCQFKNTPVSFQACLNCFESLKKEQQPLQPPPLQTQVKNYSKALYNWVAGGFESRTDEEVENIFNTFCKVCEKYDSNKQVCLHCGCKIKTGGVAISNKLKMASEHCPLGKW